MDGNTQEVVATIVIIMMVIFLWIVVMAANGCCDMCRSWCIRRRNGAPLNAEFVADEIVHVL